MKCPDCKIEMEHIIASTVYICPIYKCPKCGKEIEEGGDEIYINFYVG